VVLLIYPAIGGQTPPAQNSAKAKKLDGGPVKAPLIKVSLYFRRGFSVAPFVYFSLI